MTTSPIAQPQQNFNVIRDLRLFLAANVDVSRADGEPEKAARYEAFEATATHLYDRLAGNNDTLPPATGVEDLLSFLAARTAVAHATAESKKAALFQAYQDAVIDLAGDSAQNH